MLSIKISKFPPKAFYVCNNKEEFITVIKKLMDDGHRCDINVNDFSVPSKGIIVWLKPTLMTWSIIDVYPNTENKRNKLCCMGFKLETM